MKTTQAQEVIAELINGDMITVPDGGPRNLRAAQYYEGHAPAAQFAEIKRAICDIAGGDWLEIFETDEDGCMVPDSSWNAVQFGDKSLLISTYVRGRRGLEYWKPIENIDGFDIFRRFDDETDARARLSAIMERDRLTPGDVAVMCATSPLTVKAWMRPATNKAARQMPEMALRVLELTRELKLTRQAGSGSASHEQALDRG